VTTNQSPIFRKAFYGILDSPITAIANPMKYEIAQSNKIPNNFLSRKLSHASLKKASPNNSFNDMAN